jgi:hypothetical protein
MSSTGEWVALAVIVGGLIYTNPSVEQVELQLRQKILVDIQNAKISPGADAATNILTGICKFSSEECYKLVRATVHVETKDLFIGKVVTLTQGQVKPLKCLGVVQRLWCPGFLNS